LLLLPLAAAVEFAKENKNPVAPVTALSANACSQAMMLQCTTGSVSGTWTLTFLLLFWAV
jgi:hypothetical protein